MTVRRRGESARIRGLVKEADPEAVEDSSLEGSTRRAIDFHEGD
ncbi:MAG TPA: hypothetical protein VFW48_06740 [Solirubrobacterales bacterium]|nr:hypothetical protein [Solirubrobacterales bacterium]